MASTTNFAADRVPQAPEDPLFGLMRAFRADESKEKVDLADEILRNDPNLDHEYAPIAGIASFTGKAAELMVGADSPALKEKRVASIQTVSGTGAVHLGALFLSKYFTGNKTVYCPYPYFSKETKGLDFDGMKSAIADAPERSIILLHVCAHNPTGVDPTQEQWKQLATGFASGDLARDAWAVRYFIEQGFELVIAQSFAKNFGLYGERAGCFHFVTSPASDAGDAISRIGSQLTLLQRAEISNPLSTALRAKLEELGTPGTWNHITDQIGMFSFTGLSQAQALQIRQESHVYMTGNGRISMAGLNSRNVEYVAKAIDKVVRDAAKL
ncbi:unnamed protein product [Parascedosporium putredinis]|uniref:Aspartate aminotransferase n=1 Tax=Parascedosporium putredinis TaxID=1442378 RepID=A0A9P1GY93_9PEZI|nr:unnamed protein product [Parascedosporium putredinis]CAI7991514.1 unnamed protein product [Parascedosporium putredinis]